MHELNCRHHKHNARQGSRGGKESKERGEGNRTRSAAAVGDLGRLSAGTKQSAAPMRGVSSAYAIQAHSLCVCECVYICVCVCDANNA